MPKKKRSTKRKIDKIARKVTKAVGATKLAKYAGETIARRKNKSIKRTVTAKQARKSGASLAANIGMIAAGGAVAGTAARSIRAGAKLAKAKKAATAAKLKKGTLIRIKGQKKLVKVRRR